MSVLRLVGGFQFILTGDSEVDYKHAGALALIAGTEGPPAIVRVEIVRDETQTGPSCQSIELSTAVDRNGKELPPTSLSTLLEATL